VLAPRARSIHSYISIVTPVAYAFVPLSHAAMAGLIMLSGLLVGRRALPVRGRPLWPPAFLPGRLSHRPFSARIFGRPPPGASAGDGEGVAGVVRALEPFEATPATAKDVVVIEERQLCHHVTCAGVSRKSDPPSELESRGNERCDRLGGLSYGNLLDDGLCTNHEHMYTEIARQQSGPSVLSYRHASNTDYKLHKLEGVHPSATPPLMAPLCAGKPCKYGFPQAFVYHPSVKQLNSGLFRLSCPLLVKAVDEYEANGKDCCD
jgi:hypothetical protein